jgi:hypothetical protein
MRIEGDAFSQWSSELQHQAAVWYTGTNTLQEGTVLFQILGLLQTSRSSN